MHKYLKLSLIFVLTFFFNQSYAEIISGRVVGVSDGDTITVIDSKNTQYKIRLAGIDAPEKNQAFGKVSKQSLSDLVFEKQVNVNWQKQDRYGRTVGKVIVNGLNANLEQLNRGMAWYYKKYQNELILEDRLDYLHAEESAEKSRVGLWLDKDPIAPWDFRKSRRSN